ncbi:3604_t:CDS:1 [Scutellospora calospora]|uniref:3604_t:CDS:1 n=1 Tax=Scutellospora calospora TaxID=85575 RepID=A0ACA9JXD9_9GLOM|nr:3604_t:CDS:1 [Scutellospora calospora]
MIFLYESVRHDIIAAKLHISKGIRIYIELIFISLNKLKYYATKRVEIFNTTYYKYILTNTRRFFLLVKIGNIPLGDKDFIFDKIKEAFEDISQIASNKLLLIKGTLYLTNQ